MTPGTTPWPRETRDNLDRRPEETSNHGEQVRHMRDYCEYLRRDDPAFKALVQEFHQKNITKDQLKKEFKRRIATITPEKRAKIGLASDSDTDIEAFLSSTKYFENQLMSQIESDLTAKEKADKNMIDNCVSVVQDEYGNFDENELGNRSKKENNSRLQIFLQVPKFRKTYLGKLPGSHWLTEKTFSDINFDEITRKISKLDTSHPKRRAIQEAWLKIAQVAHPEKNLAEAFNNISHEWGAKVDIGGAYGAFFGDDNTLISRENRERILNFLTRQYVPLVPFSILETIDPKTSKKLLTSDKEKKTFDQDLPLILN